MLDTTLESRSLYKCLSIDRPSFSDKFAGEPGLRNIGDWLAGWLKTPLFDHRENRLGIIKYIGCDIK